MERLTEEQLTDMREELSLVKKQLPLLSADLRVKADLAEKALRKFEKAKRIQERLELTLAKHSGKVKIICFGRSGQAKAKPKPFDLNAFMQTLPPQAREAFIRELLNNNP